MSELDEFLCDFDLTNEDSYVPSKKQILKYKMRDLIRTVFRVLHVLCMVPLDTRKEIIENDKVEKNGCPLIYLIKDYDEFGELLLFFSIYKGLIHSPIGLMNILKYCYFDAEFECLIPGCFVSIDHSDEHPICIRCYPKCSDCDERYIVTEESSKYLCEDCNVCNFCGDSLDIHDRGYCYTCNKYC